MTRAESPPPSRRLRMAVVVAVAVAVVCGGWSWALRLPPLHPNDEPQHYLYALSLITSEGSKIGTEEVSADMQALAEAVGFGPHRDVAETIVEDSLELRYEAPMERAEGAELARVFVPDDPDQKLIPHEHFNRYHPPLYHLAVGQVIRMGLALDWGLRERLLAGRLFSILLGLVGVGFTAAAAWVIWPGRWGMACAVGLASMLQVRVAFYTSAINSEAMTFALASGFLAAGAAFVRYGPSLGRTIAGGMLLLAGLLTKVTMAFTLPLFLLAVAMAARRVWVRNTALAVLAGCCVAVVLWLVVPIGGGNSFVSSYNTLHETPRSFPPEMFTGQRTLQHARAAMRYWGGTFGNASITDASTGYTLAKAGVAIMGLAGLLGMAGLVRAVSPQRKALLWLLVAPIPLAAGLWAIDYRFASMAGGAFRLRGQYYVPIAAAQMIWLFWGMTVWLGPRVRAAAVACVLTLLAGINAFVLYGVITPRYYAAAGWWEQCISVAMLWPVPGWAVAAVDVAALVATGIAIASLAVLQWRDVRGPLDLPPPPAEVRPAPSARLR